MVAAKPAQPAKTAAVGWRASESVFVWAAYLAFHVALAIKLQTSPTLSTIHAAATIAIGLGLALVRTRPYLVVYALVYIVGAEVLWRMTYATIPWETGKYAIVLIAVTAILRSGMMRLPWRTTTYFVLLLPSVLVTVALIAPEKLQSALSSNLSGPLCLFVCVWFFSRVRLTDSHLRNLCLVAAGPIVATAAVATRVIATMDVTFGSGSNLEASGGFGPNQVSGALGLGALACFLVLVAARSHVLLRLLVLVVSLYLLAQAALTFSRGGLYMACAAALVATPFLIKVRETRMRILIGGIALPIVFVLLIFPRLNTFTEGALEDRLTDTGSTHRDEIARSDIQLFLQNPMTGVGPGRAYDARRAILGFGALPHTEFTRLLAEHGIFGLMALLLLVLEGITRVMQAKGSWSRALVVAFMTFGIVYMGGYAMRTAAPAFAFGLACATWVAATQSAEPKRVLRAEPKRVAA